MSSTVKELARLQLITPPPFLPEAMQYEVIMGSFAYGVSDDTSDVDLYGFCIPDKTEIFPHLKGDILGFGRKVDRFEQFSQHHVYKKDAMGGRGREYDITIYNITKFFQLCLENNPNMVDALFVPQRCIVFTTPIGELVRENRKLFLTKLVWHKFKGYAYAQMRKLENKKPEGNERAEMVEKHGYDLKFAYHVIRLMNEVEQILTEGDLDLERSREQLKSVRAGDWSLLQIQNYFNDKERDLEAAYASSKLPHGPDEAAIKNLLLNLLEQHFGSLEKCVVREDEAVRALQDIDNIVRRLAMRGVI